VQSCKKWGTLSHAKSDWRSWVFVTPSRKFRMKIPWTSSLSSQKIPALEKSLWLWQRFSVSSCLTLHGFKIDRESGDFPSIQSSWKGGWEEFREGQGYRTRATKLRMVPPSIYLFLGVLFRIGSQTSIVTRGLSHKDCETRIVTSVQGQELKGWSSLTNCYQQFLADKCVLIVKT